MQEVTRHVDSFSPKGPHAACGAVARSPICCIDGKAIPFDGSMADAMHLLDLNHVIWVGSCESFLRGLPEEPLLDLLVTSPPYNIGKEYETRVGRLCSSRVAKRAVRQRQWAGLGSNNRVDTVTVESILKAGCRSSPTSII